MTKIKMLTYDDDLWQIVAEYAANCSWQPTAGYFAHRMEQNDFSDWERVFAALKNRDVIGFCALKKSSTNFGDEFSPYIGFMFVDEAYRGNRISEKLCSSAIEYAKTIGFTKVHLCSEIANFYEKYGFVKIDERQAPDYGAMLSIYERNID